VEFFWLAYGVFLEKYGDSLSAEYLRGTLAIDQDADVRKAMAAALRALETKTFR
jgi:hypothetical protein